MTKLRKVASILAVAYLASACTTTHEVSQNTHFAVDRPMISQEPVSQKLNVGHTPVARFDNPAVNSTHVLSLALAEPATPLAPVALAPENTGLKPVQVTRNTPVEMETFVTSNAPDFRIVDIEVVVPEALKVSEANVRVPAADIVWREDPMGDRKAQIKRILEDAIAQGTVGLSGQRAVVLKARVTVFHALSEITRYTTGGRHNIKFDYALYDAATGQMIGKPSKIDASLRGLGGRRAQVAMAKGETQKVRISRSVAEKIKEALSARAQAG